MTVRTVAAATVLLLLGSQTAGAHDAVTNGGPFINGLLHPLITPAHLLALIGLGLWLGRQDNEALRRSIAAFAVAMIGGLIAGSLAMLPPFIPGALALVIGALAAAGWRAPATAVAMIAVAVGFIVGFDSGPDDIFLAAGIWAAAHLIVLNVVNLVMRFNAAWLIIGTRVIGAWIGAIALMLLALDFRG